MNPPRVVSLLPWLTDLVADLNLTHLLTATSHDCTASLPAATAPLLPSSATLTSLETTAGWRAATSSPSLSASPTAASLISKSLCSFYTTLPNALLSAAPTLILTHLPPQTTPLNPSHKEILGAARELLANPLLQILSFDLTTISEAYAAAHAIARALGAPHAASEAVSAAQARLRAARLRAGVVFRRRPAPRVAVVQWAAPLYIAGAWVPEAVEAAGCIDAFCRPGGPSRNIAPDTLAGVDVVVIAVCAVDLRGAAEAAREVWQSSDMFQSSKARFVVVDGTRLFSSASLATIADTAECVLEIAADDCALFSRLKAWARWTYAGGIERQERQNSSSVFVRPALALAS